MSNTLDKKIERKIRKVGNSLSVTLPKEVLEFADLKEGDTCLLYTSDAADE